MILLITAKMMASAGFVLALMAVSSPAQTQPSRTPVDLSSLGPQVGERVPDFSLRDQAGKTWTLSSISGPKGAMLVFYRSADW